VVSGQGPQLEEIVCAMQDATAAIRAMNEVRWQMPAVWRCTACHCCMFMLVEPELRGAHTICRQGSSESPLRFAKTCTKMPKHERINPR